MQELSHTYHELLNGGMYIGKTRKKKWRKRKNPCGSVFSHQEKENRLCIYGNLIFLTPPFLMVIFLLCYIFQEMINLCIKVHEGKASTTFLTPMCPLYPNQINPQSHHYFHLYVQIDLHILYFLTSPLLLPYLKFHQGPDLLLLFSMVEKCN